VDGTEDGMVEGTALVAEERTKVDAEDAVLPVRVSTGLL
jgi:hypothetical protein